MQGGSPMSCIFCTIHKEKKSVVYETEHVFVLVDRYPVATGHLIIIPKIHRQSFHLHEPEELADVLKTARHLVDRLGITEYNILQNNGNNQGVFHVHFHIIPCVSESECLQINWTTISIGDEEYARQVEETRTRLG